MAQSISTTFKEINGVRYLEYLFDGTIELEDRLLVCGDDAAETDEEMAGDLETMP